ncbi:hypothetical protein EFT87_07115 [Schleiferilactobacillus harbinensis]|jgi:hypothetical protein|uniref:hypothetical protein n=1 Tax=Schleiferilactobacillus harbinensis TaxID=304207 RepID=UPI001238D200|nr:hypothetical protein [Schleiferilactobacillus harbinensis]MCT2908432.1 hypothetical protein [Schleiferilactobacillus harbinensis]QEU46022.1 hypothetical protein FMM01_01125 [Schleiferilactobacillus harbinensis]
MAKKIYQTRTARTLAPLTISGEDVFSKTVPVYAEVDDQTGEVKLFVGHDDMARLKRLKPLSDTDGY